MTKSACPRNCEKERHLAVLDDFWIQNDKIIKIENWILNNFDLTSQPNFNVQLCGQTPATRKQCKPEKKQGLYVWIVWHEPLLLGRLRPEWLTSNQMVSQ